MFFHNTIIVKYCIYFLDEVASVNSLCEIYVLHPPSLLLPIRPKIKTCCIALWVPKHGLVGRKSFFFV